MTSPKTSDVAVQLDQLRSDIEKLTATVGELAKAKAEEAAGSLHETAAAKIRQAKDAGQDAYREAAQVVEDATQKLEARVQKNPLGAVAAAVGIGFLFGLLSGR